MTSQTVTRRAAAIALMGIAVFGVSACGSSETSNPTPATPSATSTWEEEKQTNFNGNDIQVMTEADGKVSWNVYAEEGVARGTVKVEVGGWSASSEKMTDSVYPEVHVGTYTGTVTYTNPDGGVIEKKFDYTLEKATPTMTLVNQTPSPAVAGAPITLEVKVEGNPILTGSVTALETVSNTSLGAATVNEDGIASITFTPEKEGGDINVRLTYSGDQDNNETAKTMVITLTN